MSILGFTRIFMAIKIVFPEVVYHRELSLLLCDDLEGWDGGMVFYTLEFVTDVSIFILITGKPGVLLSMGWQRVRHD